MVVRYQSNLEYVPEYFAKTVFRNEQGRKR
jgi:hypothetical protein